MNTYTQLVTMQLVPRLPLTGSIDLTYRCNNACRHCWLWQAANDPAQAATDLRGDLRHRRPGAALRPGSGTFPAASRCCAKISPKSSII